jgi:hypothetical protein
MSVDPESGYERNPQSWNRYSYVIDSPLTYNDPEGRFPTAALFTLGAKIKAHFTFTDSMDVKLCEGDICKVIAEVDRRAYTTTKLLEAVFFQEIFALATAGVGELEPIAEFGFSRIPPLPSAAHNAANFARLNLELEKTAASDAQMEELLSGGGESMAGAGGRTAIRDIDRLVNEYGGNPEDWAKIRSSNYKASDGQSFEIHAYKNIQTGEVVEFKIKFQ